jgi:hydrogenase-4 membrane subunit HyfE
LLVSPFGKHVGSIGLMFAEKLKYQILLLATYIINLPWSQKHHQVLIMSMRVKQLKKRAWFVAFFLHKKIEKKIAKKIKINLVEKKNFRL